MATMKKQNNSPRKGVGDPEQSGETWLPSRSHRRRPSGGFSFGYS
jgi:hypothetical protein